MLPPASVACGRGGNLFTPLKFRSMVPDDDGRRTPQQAHPSEELVIRVGRVMRATALDELPQMLDILRGDMSLVGPRSGPAREKAGDEEAETVALGDRPPWRRGRHPGGGRPHHLVQSGPQGRTHALAAVDGGYDLSSRVTLFFRADGSLILGAVQEAPRYLGKEVVLTQNGGIRFSF